LCLTESVVSENETLYGKNTTKIPLTPILKLLVDEGLSFFTLYQIFASVIWYFREFEIYSVMIMALALTSLVYAIYIQRKDESRINRMCVSDFKVTVIRLDEAG